MSESAVFALALHRLPGLGRVSVGRLLAHFSGYEALLDYPHEQILTRLRGIPNASALTAHLLDRGVMEEALASAQQEFEALGRKGVTPLTCRHPRWPAGLDDLAPRHRPTLLFAYGHLDALDRTRVSFLARPPLDPPPFELAQALVASLPDLDAVPVAGAGSGFDVVVLKRATDADAPLPTVVVASTGLARVSPEFRPAISATVKAGGLLLSPFPMTHGPFEHDERESTLVRAALGHAVVGVGPRPGTPEWAALDWASGARRPVFGLSGTPETLPASIHPITDPVDFDWIRTALGPNRS